MTLSGLLLYPEVKSASEVTLELSFLLNIFTRVCLLAYAHNLHCMY